MPEGFTDPDLNARRLTKLMFARTEQGATITCVYADGHQEPLSHPLVKHSPTGFEWGYGGSGPADLALNILNLFVGSTTAYLLYQDFKADKIATMPSEGGELSSDEIRTWITGKGVTPNNW